MPPPATVPCEWTRRFMCRPMLARQARMLHGRSAEGPPIRGLAVDAEGTQPAWRCCEPGAAASRAQMLRCPPRRHHFCVTGPATPCTTFISVPSSRSQRPAPTCKAPGGRGHRGGRSECVLRVARHRDCVSAWQALARLLLQVNQARGWRLQLRCMRERARLALQVSWHVLHEGRQSSNIPGTVHGGPGWPAKLHRPAPAAAGGRWWWWWWW